MANPWFRMYSEFSHDPKVQMLSEVMQRRYVMLMCLRCSNTLVTLHETEVAFHLRINDEEMAQTKALFISKGFIDSDFNLLNWEKRQSASDSSAARVAKHRMLQKAKQEADGNGDVTLHETDGNALDKIRIDKKEAKASKSPAKLPTLPACDAASVIELYHAELPELPSVRLQTSSRTKAIKKLWSWVLTSKKSDNTPRATNAAEALEWIRGYFARARDNDFLMGRSGRVGEHANWQCDFDFLLTEKGITRVIEKTKAAP